MKFRLLLLGSVLLCYDCRVDRGSVEPSIEFTMIPAAGEGNPEKLLPIAGRAHHARAGQKIVLFARSGVWWVQPTTQHPFTDIHADSTWKTETHPGSGYAALLVDPGYRPPATTADLPAKGGAVVAVLSGQGKPVPDEKIVTFSGYQWQVRQAASNRGGTTNQYSAANAWTDKNGFLHLRIEKQKNQWSSAEVSLDRSLGYGSYRFVVRDVMQLEPAAVFDIFTWDPESPREMDIEISRWGESAGKNAQYVVQPFYVPANAVRFTTPPGELTYSFRWEPGQVKFATFRGAVAKTASPVAEHVFTSGVPSEGSETIRLSLYVFDNKQNPLVKSCEVIVEKFEYLP